MKGFAVGVLLIAIVGSTMGAAKEPCKPYMVRVRVLDMKGDPVQYANVFGLWTHIGGSTNEAGWVTLEGLPGDSVTVRVKTVASGARVRVLPDSCGTNPVVVRLGADRKIRWIASDFGVVEEDNLDRLDRSEGNCEALVVASDSASGRPIVGAMITATSLGQTDNHAVATDSLGQARIRHLHVGRYSLGFCAEQYGRHSEQREVWVGAVDTVWIALPLIVRPSEGRGCEEYRKVPVGVRD